MKKLVIFLWAITWTIPYWCCIHMSLKLNVMLYSFIIRWFCCTQQIHGLVNAKWIGQCHVSYTPRLAAHKNNTWSWDKGLTTIRHKDKEERWWKEENCVFILFLQGIFYFHTWSFSLASWKDRKWRYDLQIDYVSYGDVILFWKIEIRDKIYIVGSNEIGDIITFYLLCILNCISKF
jgi:hypothetical protein